jgi:hypothetical protein
MKTEIEFPTEAMSGLNAYYSGKNVRLNQVDDAFDEKDITSLIIEGMPVLYKNQYSYTSKGEACNNVLNALGNDTPVNVRYSNFADPNEYSYSRKNKMLLFGDYINNYFKGDVSNEYHYLGNLHLNGDQYNRLGIKKPSYLLNEDISTGALWIGKRGCITPLHCDGPDIFVYQLFGIKKWTIFPPTAYPSLYTNRPATDSHPNFYTSAVDLRNVDEFKFPNFRKAQSFEFILHPGDSLFLPSGWFHYVETLEDSVMINFWIINQQLTPIVLSN